MFSRKKVDDTQTSELASKLGDVSFFDGFTPSELERVAQLAEDVEAETGAELIDQGRVGQECFVILDGKAGVYVAGEHVATIEAGSMVGEMALIEHRPRNATVVAETPMKLVSFNTRAFKQLLTEMPKAHDRVMETLADRMRARGDA